MTTSISATRSNVMKSAWTLVKQAGYNLSNALKEAWSKLKKTMTNTFDLATTSLDELVALQVKIEAEIASRSAAIEKPEFDLIFDLESKKMNEVSKKQYDYADNLAYKTGSKIPNCSQVMRYCSSETISEAIDAMKHGKKIKLF